MPRKTIEYLGYDGIQDGAKQPWSDTWIRFFNRRTKIYRGPCFISRPHHEFDLEFEAKYIAEKLAKGEDPGDIGYAPLPTGSWKFSFARSHQEITQATGTPNIVLNVDYIDRDAVEAAAGWYLETVYGFKGPFKHRWRNHKYKHMLNSF